MRQEAQEQLEALKRGILSSGGAEVLQQLLRVGEASMGPAGDDSPMMSPMMVCPADTISFLAMAPVQCTRLLTPICTPPNRGSYVAYRCLLLFDIDAARDFSDPGDRDDEPWHEVRVEFVTRDVTISGFRPHRNAVTPKDRLRLGTRTSNPTTPPTSTPLVNH